MQTVQGTAYMYLCPVGHVSVSYRTYIAYSAHCATVVQCIRDVISV